MCFEEKSITCPSLLEYLTVTELNWGRNPLKLILGINTSNINMQVEKKPKVMTDSWNVLDLQGFHLCATILLLQRDIKMVAALWHVCD